MRLMGDQNHAIRAPMYRIGGSSGLEFPPRPGRRDLGRAGVSWLCGSFPRDSLAGVLAFRGDFAQAYVLKAGPDEAYGDDGQEGGEQQDSRTSRGSLSIRAKKAGQRGGDDSDLGEPAKDWKLKDARTATGNHEENASGWRDGSQRKRLATFEVGSGNQQPHGDGERGGDTELSEGAHGIESGVEGANFFSDRDPELL